MKKITPFLWFDSQAEEAAKFYVSIFKNSKIVGVTRYGEAGPGPQGSVMTVTFERASRIDESPSVEVIGFLRRKCHRRWASYQLIDLGRPPTAHCVELRRRIAA